MKTKMFLSVIVLDLLFGQILLFPSEIYAQHIKNLTIPDSIHTQILMLKDGSKLIGRIVEIGESEIQFEMSLGKMTILRSKIKGVEVVSTSSIRNGEYWFPNPNNTRLYFAPTARNLKKGEGYFADYFFVFPGIAYGVTDNITIGGGMSIIPGVDIPDQLFYFTPKIGGEISKDLNVAVGALVATVPDSFDSDAPTTAGIFYTVGTYGTPDASVTAGIGYGYVGDEFADRPMVMVSGEKRLSRRISFVTENWMVPGVDNLIISYGVRFFSESLSVDLGLVNILGEDTFFPGIPYIDFVYNF